MTSPPHTVPSLQLSDLLKAVLCGVFVSAVCLVPTLVNPGFYFKDDNQIYFQPYFAEIARLITSGEWPLSTFRSWYGGGIAGEYQTAIFNPFSIALYLLIYPIDNLATAAAIFSLAHIFVLASGTHLTARLLNASPTAAPMAAFIACTGTWTLYWAAVTWIPALVSLSWFAWALAGLILTYRHRRWLALGAATCALTFLSGWPLTNLVLCLTAGIVLLLLWRSGHDRKACVRTLTALALGIGFAMPALLSISGFMSGSGRDFQWGTQWQANLGHLFMVGVPSSFSVWQTFDGTYKPIPVPFAFASWLIPFSLVLLDWRSVDDLRRNLLKLLAVLVVFAAVLTMLPALVQLRWPFKALAFLHLFLGLFVAVAVSSLPDKMNRSRRAYVVPALLLIGLPSLYALLQAPALWSAHLVFMVQIILSAQLIFWAWDRNRLARDGAMTASHVVMFLTLVLLVPDNTVLIKWPLPATKSEISAFAPERPERRFYLYGDYGGIQKGVNFYGEMAHANTVFFHNGETVNGYSPLKPAGFKHAFCFMPFGGHCGAGNVSALFEPVGDLGLNALDITAVDAVIASKGPYAEAFANAMGPGWRLRAERPHSVIFERVRPHGESMAPLAYRPAGLEVGAVRRTARGMTLDLASKSDFKGGDLLLATPWRPGYRATLDGKPLPVESYHGLVPRIRIPPGMAGTLHVTYWPKGLTAGLVLAALSLITLLILMLRPTYLSTFETSTNVLVTRAVGYLSQRFL